LSAEGAALNFQIIHVIPRIRSAIWRDKVPIGPQESGGSAGFDNRRPDRDVAAGLSPVDPARGKHNSLQQRCVDTIPL